MFLFCFSNILCGFLSLLWTGSFLQGFLFVFISHSPLPHVAGTDDSPSHERADSSEKPHCRPPCGLGWVRHSLSKKQLQLQCSRRVTQVGENGRGLLRLGMDLLPHTQPAQGDPGVNSLCLTRSHARLYLGSSWAALGPTDRAGSNKGGFGHTSRSSGRVRDRWWLPLKLNGERRGGRAAAAEMTVRCEIGISVKFKIF